MKKKSGLYRIVLCVAVLILVVFNIMGCSEKFCDFYVLNIYPYAADTVGIISDKIPFSVGEIIMYIAMACTLVLFLSLLSFIFLRKKQKFRRFMAVYSKSYLMIFVLALLVYTLNWFIPLRTSPLEFDTDPDRVYTFAELETLRNYLVNELNSCCDSVERGSNGYPVVKEDYSDEISESLLSLKDEFPSICSYCPRSKQLICSPFLDWMNIGGFTFPYTMEIAVNKYCSEFYIPSLEAHELSHHMGFYRENEAMLLEYLVCTNSDDKFVQYSGLWNVTNYVSGAYYDSMVTAIPDTKERLEYFSHQPFYDERCLSDHDYFLNKIEEIYEEEVSDKFEDQFEGISESVAEVGWDTQADLLQDAVYSGVTELLLKYYDGILY